MKNLFFTGGPLFMSILSLLLIASVSWLIYHFLRAVKGRGEDKQFFLRKLSSGKSIGLFALIIGILGQLIGLYDAFSTIEQIGEVSPSMLYGGFKVSMITTLFGILIYLVSLALWFGLSQAVEGSGNRD